MISENRRFITTLAWLLLTLNSQRSEAQGVGEAPRAEYYLARELYEAGRMADATEGFQLTLSRSMRIGERAWIDSIPPLVLLGESYFQVGKVALAMEQYDAALLIALAHPNWLDQVSVQSELAPLESKAKGIHWFTPSRASQAVALPEPGQLTVEPAGPAGAGQPLAFTTRVDTAEVLRTLGLALVRRGEVLGPLAKHSPLAQPLQQMLAREVQSRAAWAQSAWRLLRAFQALSITGAADAETLLRENALLGERFETFMTPLALLELGKLQWRQGDVAAALPNWQDATSIAARCEQYSLLAETLQTLSAACTAGNRIDLLSAIQNAAIWGVKRSAAVQAHGFAGAAELATMSGDWAAAEANAKQATSALRIRDVNLPRAQAQLFFANALIAFGENRGALGQQSLESALKIMRGTALDGALARQIFQSQMVLDLFQNGAMQAVDADQALTEILREPDAYQWHTAPLEMIAAMTTSAVPAYATWLELAERRGTKDQLVERMDRLQRQRFYEVSPLGGRLFSWRAAALGDPRQLPPEVQGIVADTLRDSPNLAKSTQRLAAMIIPLETLPLPLEERLLNVESRKAFTEYGKAIEHHENLLNLQALQRKPLDRFVPFSASIQKTQIALADNDLVLSFVSTGGKLYGAALTKSSVETWSTTDLPAIEEHIKTLLKDIGMGSAPKLTPSEVTAANASWQEAALNIQGKLLPAKVQSMVANSERIIVVPDGALWYLPFELLPNSARTPQAIWLSRHAVIYLPTLGSLPLISLPGPTVQRTLQVSAPFFSPDKSLNESLSEKLLQQVAGSQRVEIAVKNFPATANWARMLVEQLVVTTKIEPAQRLWDTNFFPLDGAKSTQLGSWTETPRRAPARLILPGYQSSAAAGNVTDGHELFLPACALLYSGTRTVLLSRWQVGGRSTQVVLSRYLQELNSERPSTAWQRSAAALWADDFLLADEPALQPSGKDAAALVHGRHPKLWSGYMVIGDSQPPLPSLP